MKRLCKEEKDKFVEIVKALQLKGLNDCAIRRHLKTDHNIVWQLHTVHYYEHLANLPAHKDKLERENKLMAKWNSGTDKVLTAEEEYVEELSKLMQKDHINLDFVKKHAEVEYEDLR